jgi:hypothetical protein
VFLVHLQQQRRQTSATIRNIPARCSLRRKPQPGSQSTTRKWKLADRDREHRQQTERFEVLTTIEQHFKTIRNISEIS